MAVRLSALRPGRPSPTRTFQEYNNNNNSISTNQVNIENWEKKNIYIYNKQN
jgi:hypothetical protein